MSLLDPEMIQLEHSHREMRNPTSTQLLPTKICICFTGFFHAVLSWTPLSWCETCSNAWKACRYLDRWPTHLTPRMYLCSDAADHGFQDTSLSVCEWWKSVCVKGGGGEERISKLHFHFWCHAGYKWALGPSDQPLHQFTAGLEGLLLLSFSSTDSLFVTFLASFLPLVCGFSSSFGLNPRWC